MSLKKINKNKSQATDYHRFDEIDGGHPWKVWVPEGQIGYKVRQLEKGRVLYFNFELAKEMGLIPTSHTNDLNRNLEKKILQTFNIRIINEYDINTGAMFKHKNIKPKEHMATRYLQMQHKDKRGKTSGDGRSIWNGHIKSGGTTWDVSSRGTGVTALAPGAVEAGKPIQSGDTKFGYGCGLAEIDELISSAILSEIFHKQSIGTERVLTVIDTGDGHGIGVRAGKNLTRPAHVFQYLKQENHDALKRSADYLIHRQAKNKRWSVDIDSNRKYQQALKYICNDFAQFAAKLEREYIFTWLDWDGDNVLADAGILDYGSVRQFGIRHDQYRYDDVERYSTNLNEQKNKARLTVQLFAQTFHFIKTKKKRTLESFKNDNILKQFNAHYEDHLLKSFAYQLGLDQLTMARVLKHNKLTLKKLYKCFSYFEQLKITKWESTADGINKPALTDMRAFLREAPTWVLAQSPKAPDMDAFCDIISYTENNITPTFQKRFKQLVKYYGRIMSNPHKATIKAAQTRNRIDRMSGNALINIVQKLMTEFKNKPGGQFSQKLIEALIHWQTKDTTLQQAFLDSGLLRKKAFAQLIEEITDEWRFDI